MKKSLLLILPFIFVTHVYSQNINNYLKKSTTEKAYKRMMEDPSINFYDVCKAADLYFKNHDPNIKGSGWKGYARWRNANEYKFYPSGDRSNIDPYFTSNNYLSFLEKNPQQNSRNSTRSSSRMYSGWRDLGPYRVDSLTGHYSAGMGRLVAVYVDPANSSKIYVGSRTGGFWKTNDEGVNWKVTTDFLPATGVNAIDASPTNSDSVLINVNNARNHYSHGVYRSVNGGNTWVKTNFNPKTLGKGGLGSNFSVYKIKYHPSIPNLIFVAASDGLYRSTDNLATWTKVITGNIRQIDFHPTNPNILFIHNRNINNVVLYSLNAGLTFSQSNLIPGNNGNKNIIFSTSNECVNCLYVASSNGIWKSTDTAKSFVFLGNSSESCLGFSVNDNDTSNMIYGYVDIDRSTNGGKSWTDATKWSLGNSNGAGAGNQVSYNTSTNYVHADLQQAICVNGIFYVVTDGTISKSNDKGISWKNIGQGLGIRMNYKLGASQSNTFRAICGSQDNGTSIKHKDTWIELYGADGMESLIHPLNDDWMIGSVQYGARIGTKNGGQTVGFFPKPSGESGSGNAYWEAPITYDPNNHMTLYNFSKYLYKSDNFGKTWDSVSAPTSFTGTIERAAVAENNSNIIVISRGSAIEKSVDGGLSWTDIRGTLPNSSIQDIAFDPNNDDVIMIVYASYQNNGNKIFKSIDGGNTWINITHNLGNMPLHTVVIDHQDASNIYIGAEIGVYTMPMNSSTWTLYNTDLPNNSIQELEIVYGSNSIKAATWGRGLWEYTLVGRNSFPRIMTTRITNIPTEDSPKEGADQFVTSTISYSNTLSSVYLEWSKDTAVFGNVIQMSNVSDSTWVSDSIIPFQVKGTKIYFKVFAVGNNNDTTETYKFMYTVKPFEYCTATGTNDGYNLYLNNVTLANINNSTTNDGYAYYNSTPISLDAGKTYTLNLSSSRSWSGVDYGAWIDFNHNAVFENSETIIHQVNTGSNSTSATFTIPIDAITGDTIRLRAKTRYWGSGIIDPCETSFGEIEDYAVIVTAPKLSFTIDERSICANEKIHFDYAGDTLTSILWTFKSGTDSITSSKKIDSLTISKAGIYSLRLQGTIGSNTYLLDTTALFIVNNSSSATLNITSCNPADTGITYDTLINSVGCDSIITKITSLGTIVASITVNGLTLTANPSGLTYQWLDCNNSYTPLAGETNQTYIAEANGSYAVKVTDMTCTDTAICHQVINVGIVSNDFDNDIILYPNPTSGLLRVEMNGTFNVINVRVTNELGQEIISETVKNSNFNVDITKQSSGIYFLHLNTNEKKAIFKVIKND